MLCQRSIQLFHESLIFRRRDVYFSAHSLVGIFFLIGISHHFVRHDIFDRNIVLFDQGEQVFCYGMRDHFGILCDGTVVPCCLDGEGQIPLGNLFNKSGCDIIAVQEDFTFHDMMVQDLSKTLYPYWTYHTGGVPGGDGLNIFSKYKLYNEERTTWRSLSGVIEGGADELTPKGFVYSVIDIGNGIYVDFYNLHADAYGGAGSIAARTSPGMIMPMINSETGTPDKVVIKITPEYVGRMLSGK